MRKTNIAIHTFLMLVPVLIFAQDFRFGKVKKEELLEVVHPLDVDAEAAVLYEERRINFEYSDDRGFEVITEVFKRVKFYNKRGFNQATHEVFLYHNGGDSESIYNIKGVTYSLKGDEIVETKLKKEGVFRNEYSEHYEQVKFTMPNVTEGGIIEYKYKIISPFTRSTEKIALQYKIPIKNLNVKLRIPEYYGFNPRNVGYLPINFEKSKTSGKITFSSNNTLDYLVNNYELNKKNIPAFEVEPYSGNTKNYISGVIFELEFTNFPNSPINSYSTTWDAVIELAYNDSRFGGELKKSNYFKEDINKLISGVNDSDQKIKLIYEYVRDRMVWNDVSSVVPRKTLKKPYIEKVGNSAEVNLILIAMLDYAGIKVNPVLVTTNKKPLSLFPTLEGLNYVIARVKNEGEILFLDATDKFGQPNVLPNRVIQGVGRLINEKGNSEMVFFRDPKLSKKKVKMMCELSSDGVVTGKQRTVYTLHEAHDFRKNNGALSNESNIKRLNKNYSIKEVSDLKLANIKNLDKPVQEVFAFETSEEVEIIGDEMFFSPMLYLRKKENLFKSEERNYPVDFGYIFSNEFYISLKIPEGFQVSSSPKDMGLMLPENLGKFVFKTSVNQGVLQVSVTTTLNESVISSEDYMYLREFYNKIVEKENEPIVLKKT